MAEKFYAIKKGYDKNKNKVVTNKIVITWPDCQALVSGVKGALYKSFPSKEEAEQYLKRVDEKAKEKNSEKDIQIIQKRGETHIYVDGSYSKDEECFSYALIIVKDKVVRDIIYGKSMPNELPGCQIPGEIKAASLAIDYAVRKHLKKLTILHDYIGISEYAKEGWRGKEKYIQDYVAQYKWASKKISIEFTHVKGHSDNIYNELADSFTKLPLGIPRTNAVDKWLGKNTLVVASEQLKDEVIDVLKNKGLRDKIVTKDDLKK